MLNAYEIEKLIGKAAKTAFLAIKRDNPNAYIEYAFASYGQIQYSKSIGSCKFNRVRSIEILGENFYLIRCH